MARPLSPEEAEVRFREASDRLEQSICSPITRHPLTSLAGAFFSGFISGRSGGLIRALFSLLFKN